MEQIRLGHTGLKVSRICLGTMTYGDPKWRDWVLTEDKSRPFIQRALEAGITFFDTADIYSNGASEQVVGNLLAWASRPNSSAIGMALFRSRGRQLVTIGRQFVMYCRDQSCVLLLLELGLSFANPSQFDVIEGRVALDERGMSVPFRPKIDVSFT